MLKVGDSWTLEFCVTPNKTVPYLYPESKLFREMPEVFATGFLVGLMEWCCIEHLTQAGLITGNKISLGLGVNIVHSAPCTSGSRVKVFVECLSVRSSSVEWHVIAKVGDLVIGEGTHKRVIVDRAKFENGVNDIAAEFGGNPL